MEHGDRRPRGQARQGVGGVRRARLRLALWADTPPA